jgi:hypothetical protein
MRNTCRRPTFFIWAVFLGSLFAMPAFSASPRPTNQSFSRLSIDLFLPVISDFDGDNKLDRASLSSHGEVKTIHVAFGKSTSRSLTFKSSVSEHGHLISGDVDEDGDLDLIWVSQTAEKFVALLGDGRGHFSLDEHGTVHPDRFRSLLEHLERGSVANASEPSTSGILPGGAFVVAEPFRGNRVFIPTFFVTSMTAPAGFSVSYIPGLRAPPSLFF